MHPTDRNSIMQWFATRFIGCGALKMTCCSLISPSRPTLPPLMTPRVQLRFLAMNSTRRMVTRPMLLVPSVPVVLKPSHRYRRSLKGIGVSSLRSPLSSIVQCHVVVSHSSRAL